MASFAFPPLCPTFDHEAATAVLPPDVSPTAYWAIGLDPGWAADTAAVLALVEPGESLHVCRVFSAPHVVLADALHRLCSQGWQTPSVIAADPIVCARSWQTGVSDAEVLHQAGYRVRPVRIAKAVRLGLLRKIADPAGVPIALRLHPLAHEVGDALATHKAIIDGADAFHAPGQRTEHVVDALSYLAVLACSSDSI